MYFMGKLTLSLYIQERHALRIMAETQDEDEDEAQDEDEDEL